MKCKDCTACVKGFFKSQPDRYVCTGTKDPFVVGNINQYCTEYEKKEEKHMVNRKSWKEFRESGMLWWINMILHTMGWAIAYNFDDDGNISEVFPARVKYRGFSDGINTDGYIKVSKYMKENADELLEEAEN